jgi:hypothetical protein
MIVRTGEAPAIIVSEVAVIRAVMSLRPPALFTVLTTRLRLLLGLDGAKSYGCGVLQFPRVQGAISSVAGTMVVFENALRASIFVFHGSTRLPLLIELILQADLPLDALLVEINT